MTTTDPAPAATSESRELRLALVLYGGVSLAIYMHGTAKEIHRLVRASAHPADRDDTGLTATERVWRDLLEDKARRDGVATRVVVDVIAGTSAGGINGVYLAKALAHDLPQDSLRDLWLDKGDIGALIRRWKWLPGPLQRRLPWQLRALWAVPMVWRTPLLDGDEMASWLYGALDDMDRASDTRRGEPRSLVPADQQLHLFVTVTDFYGYERDVVIDSPPVVHDRRHRHVLRFTFGDGRDDFAADPARNGALAFAARTTSSFPGGFPPVSFTGFERSLRRHSGVALDLSQMESTGLFRQYPLAKTTARAGVFIDGGVLDNFPFGHAIAAVRQQPAHGEVDRRLLYLDPDPAERRPANGQPKPQPGPLGTVVASLAGLPRHEPILDDLLNLGVSNRRVRELREVIRTSWPVISTTVDKTLEGVDLGHPPADPSGDTLAGWQKTLHDEAMRQLGPSYTTYLRTKLAAVVAGWADMVCRQLEFPADCTQAGFVRQVLWTWAGRSGLFPEDQREQTQQQTEFLRDFDLRYRERRLRFVIAGLSWWYEDPDDEAKEFVLPTRAQLDAGKTRLYEAVAELRAAMRGQDTPAELTRQVSACFHEDVLDRFLDLPRRPVTNDRVDTQADRPDRGRAGDDHPGVTSYLEEKQADLDQLAAAFRAHLTERFAGFTAGLYGDMYETTADWAPEARRRLLIRYLGFPLWDAVLFPLQWATGVEERDHAEIVRLSPRDPSLLDVLVDGDHKLAGSRWHHFGAFLDRAGREKDYLWGRLDAAEQLVSLLLGRDHDDHERWCRKVFLAIAEEEEKARRRDDPGRPHRRRRGRTGHPDRLGWTPPAARLLAKVRARALGNPAPERNG